MAFWYVTAGIVIGYLLRGMTTDPDEHCVSEGWRRAVERADRRIPYDGPAWNWPHEKSDSALVEDTVKQ
jgi:hypothetical protein